MLHSGVHVVKAFQVAGMQSSNRQLRVSSKSIVDELRRGNGIAPAMRIHSDQFPILLMDLIDIAEQTGSMPEVLASLADHYDNLVRLRRTFLSAISWPVFQLIAAIFIVAGLIAILGWISPNSGESPMDVTGLGLSGTSGALTWLGGCFGTAFLGFVAYQLLTRGLNGQAIVHRLLLRLPVVGSCLRSFAIARFAWAFALTQQSGMEIDSSMDASLKATANGAFVESIPQTLALIRSGEDLATTLEATHLYSREFLELVRVGETTGTVPEQLQRLSPQLEDRARRSLETMTAAFAWLIWAMVAGLIIFIIFRIFLNYIALIDEAQRGIK